MIDLLQPPREISLYDYQEIAVEGLRQGFRNGVSWLVLCAPTGSGKTEMAMKIIIEAVRKGSPVWFVVDRLALVDQASKRFDVYGIDHGIIQADHPRSDPKSLVQIVTPQTLQRRTIREIPKLVIWDECHSVYRPMLDLLARLDAVGVKVIGLTATPFTAGMADNWGGLVNTTTTNRLLEQKILSPLRIKACVTPDMKDAKRTRAGEYDEDDAGERGITIIGDVVQTWVAETAKAFGGPVKTIVFSPSVKHGAELCRQFADAGYNFQQISYLDKKDGDREAKIAEFRKPDSAIDGLISCAVLTKGFDVPDVLCGISCRPYRKSLSSHVQELGRVMRRSPKKEFGLWLDHSGNCISFAEDVAWLYEYGVDSLSSAQKKDSEVREPKEKVKADRFCAECGSQMEPRCDACPDCGWERPHRGEIKIVQGELIDFNSSLGSAASFRPRQGLRSECLKDPRGIWNAALAYCLANGRKGADASRKWAFGIWAGIYPGCKLPRGLYEAPCRAASVQSDEWGLIEREVKRFRKTAGRAA